MPPARLSSPQPRFELSRLISSASPCLPFSPGPFSIHVTGGLSSGTRQPAKRHLNMARVIEFLTWIGSAQFNPKPQTLPFLILHLKFPELVTVGLRDYCPSGLEAHGNSGHPGARRFPVSDLADDRRTPRGRPRLHAEIERIAAGVIERLKAEFPTGAQA